MPHLIDFDSVEERLFVLQHLCYGSRQFCEHYSISRESEALGDYEWWEYYGFLKTIVSTTMIEAAVKLRMVQDFIRSADAEVDLDLLDREAVTGLHIGAFMVGTGSLTLRESCNKLVHATEAKLLWAEHVAASTPVEYWSGTFHLWGSKAGSPWQVELLVPAWCTAMIRLNKAVQQAVDWRSIAKWDE